jgi:hypothetical protein
MYAEPTLSALGRAAVVALDEVDEDAEEDELLDPHAAARSGNAPSVAAPRAARTIKVRRANNGESACSNPAATNASISAAPRATAEFIRPLTSISAALGVAVTP